MAQLDKGSTVTLEELMISSLANGGGTHYSHAHAVGTLK